MTDRIEALERRLAEIENRLEIYRLLAALGPMIDGGGDRDVAELFSDDAHYFTDVPGFVPMTGRSGVESIFASAIHRRHVESGIAHVLGFPHVNLVGDRAEAVNHSIVFVKGENGWQPGRIAANHFRLEKREGRWQDGRCSARQSTSCLADPAARMPIFTSACSDLARLVMVRGSR
jgi:hypothetical protein